MLEIIDVVAHLSLAVLCGTLLCQQFQAKIDRKDYIGISHEDIKLESLELN